MKKRAVKRLYAFIVHNDVEFKGIEFKPSAEFTNELKKKVAREGFRYVHKTDSSVLMANEAFMEQALRKSINAEGGYTTVASFQFYSGLTKYSAAKKLWRWCIGDSPRLKERRLGHSIIYEVIHP